MKLSLSILGLFLCFFATAKTDNIPASIYGFKVTALNGATIDLSQYRGKKILIVNTPEEADFSLQYSELEKLHEQYKEKLVIIGFITNDFQIEPGSKKNPGRPRNYKVTFPLAAKVLVRGDDMAPIYQWLTQKKYNNLQDSEIAWDFQKFLFDENGKLVSIFEPMTHANSKEIISAIEK
jgi:glutathione peroxidase